jgi:preprotein translocase subunit SecD
MRRVLAVPALLALGVAVTGCGILRRSPAPEPSTVGDRVVLTLRATDTNGTAPSAVAMNGARNVLSDRFAIAGGTWSNIQVKGDELIVTESGIDPETLRRLAQPGRLRLRKVLGTTTDSPPHAGAVASAPPSANAAPSSTGNAALDAVRAKLGGTWDYGRTVLAAIEQGALNPTQLDAQTEARLAPFALLSGPEVAVLPLEMQYLLPTVTCQELNARPTEAVADPKQQVVVCDYGDDVHTKYALDTAKVVDTDVASATAGNDPNNGGWNVELKFTASGQARWTALTQEAVDQGKQIDPNTGQQGQNASVAIVVDAEVISAPQIQSVIAGDAVINGGTITRQSATVMAALLARGALPLDFEIESLTR